MKILVTADWHAHNFKDFSKTLTVKWDKKIERYCISEDENSIEMNSRLFNILNAICDMRDYAFSKGISNILIGGDIFHHRATLDVSVFNTVHKVLSTFPFYNIVGTMIAGNHDQVDASDNPCSSIYGLKDLVHVIEKPQEVNLVQDDEIVRVVALPHSKSKRAILKQIEKFKPDTDSILLAHLGVDGGAVGSGMYVMKDEYTLAELKYDEWKYVVLGHYHQPQLLAHNALYCGSPTQNNFGDERIGKDKYNGFFVIDTNKKYEIEFVPIIAPRFITFSSIEELESFDKNSLYNNFIRVKATDTNYEEVFGKLSEIFETDSSPVRIEVEKSYEVEHRSDIGVIATPQDNIITYVNEVWDNPLILNERVISLGTEIMEEALSQK